MTLLNRNSAYDVGHTLIHLAIRFHREGNKMPDFSLNFILNNFIKNQTLLNPIESPEMLPMLLTQISGSGPGIKRVPSYVAPDLASDIRRHFAASLRMRKNLFNCMYVTEHATFSLPAEIEGKICYQ